MTHDHAAHAAPRDFGAAFAWGIGLNAAYVLVEVGFGFVSGSLALIADAAHNLTDVAGLLLAWGASVLARRRPSERHTYGLGRASILAALGNGVALLIAVGALATEAFGRIWTPAEVPGSTVLWVAALGIAINTGTALLFLRGRGHDLNVEGAFLHMAADAAVSGGVVLSAIAMIATGWTWIDPLTSLLLCVAIAWSAFGLLKSALHLGLDGVPDGIDRKAVADWLVTLPGVSSVHDLHIWALSTTTTALTAHLVVPGGSPDDTFLDEAAEQLEHRFGIGHTTLQIERGDGADCRLAAPNVVRWRLRTMVEDRMTVDASRDVSAILTAEHLRLILKEHLLTPEELNDPDRLRGLVQSMVDKAIGFPEDAWHQWDDWAKGLE